MGERTSIRCVICRKEKQKSLLGEKIDKVSNPKWTPKSTN